MPDKLDTEFACSALESLAREQAHSSVMLGAIELAAFSLLFIGTPKPPSSEEHEDLAHASPLKILKEWVSLGQTFDEYLQPWKEELTKCATPEQHEFLRRLESTSDAEPMTPMHELDSRPFVEALPRPENALIALDNLGSTVPKDSIHYAHVGLAIHALRFIRVSRSTKLPRSSPLETRQKTKFYDNLATTHNKSVLGSLIPLQKENVNTLPMEVFDKVDKLVSPHLVEYWDQDPCAPPEDIDDFAGPVKRKGGVMLEAPRDEFALPIRLGMVNSAWTIARS